MLLIGLCNTHMQNFKYTKRVKFFMKKQIKTKKTNNQKQNTFINTSTTIKNIV